MVELGAAGATVYCTGRTTRGERSEMDRPETIEETAAVVDAAGGRGIAVQVDHLEPRGLRPWWTASTREQGALHVLVNDIWGATTMEWDKTVWESSLDIGLETLRRAVDTHAITAHFALPLLIRSPGGLVVEATDGTAEYNATNYRVSFFYDLAKAANLRTAFALGHELAPYPAQRWHSPRAGCVPRRCSRPSASPRPTGGRDPARPPLRHRREPRVRRARRRRPRQRP